MRRFGLAVVCVAFCTLPAIAQQSTVAPARQALSDAWWTGPMLAASAATLPGGHILVEPYLFDTVSSTTNDYGTLTYLLYGVTNRLTAGVTVTSGYIATARGTGSAGMAFGDTTAIVQYGLTQFREGNPVPATALVFEETIPTGRYDDLGDRPNDATGAGAYTTSLGIYTQKYFWLPNGRIVRARFDLLQSFSRRVAVQGASVYGTDTAFQGAAYPGASSYVDLAGEYSATRNWVPALDVTYRYAANTRVVNAGGLATGLGSSAAYAFAPAIEYNWAATWGVLLGTRIVPKGHNALPSTTPALAIDFVR